MGRSGGCVRIAEAAEDPEVIIIRLRAKEKLKGTRRCTGPTWAPVEHVCGRRERVRPEHGWGRRLKEHCADAIIQCAEDSFRTPILLRRVRAGETKCYAMNSEERSGGRVIKFPPIVSLQAHNRNLELGANECMEGD